jgi:transglutaminase-like putative cysteine protease
MHRSCLLLAFIILSSWSCFAAAPSPVSIAPPAEWLGALEPIDLAATPADKSQSGHFFLLFERQIHVEKAETFSRVAYRITAQSALQDGARISIDYDPEYEQIDFHFLRVVRDGQSSERLSADALKILQQERDLDRHLYNGQFTALVLLEDVRLGDTVDYAYTRRGRNPIFDGRFHETVPVRWTAPIHRVKVRVLHEKSRPFFFKLHGEAKLHAETGSQEGLTARLWTGKNLTPLENDSEQPVWHQPYSFLQFTEYADWQGVVAWAQTLYSHPGALSPTLRDKLAEIVAKADTVETRTMAILDFVQRDIRYLGIELGPRSHRPSPPEQVLARRFGDCKDKTLLFCALARAAGIDATPALTHSTHRHLMLEWLPSPDAFDHVIARIEAKDFSKPDKTEYDFLKDNVRLGSRTRFFWVDPTIAEQAGSLEHRSVPNYGFALPIATGVKALSKVDLQPGALASIQINERYDLAQFDGPATLEVQSRYSGSVADAMRTYLQETPIDQVAKNFLNARTRLYPTATQKGQPEWTDDRQTNSVVITHQYVVPEFWKKQEKTSVLQADIYSLSLRDYTEPPASLQRTAPLAVPHPLRISHEAVLQLPHAWPTAKSHREFDDPAFIATSETNSTGSTVRLAYSWQSRSDHVPMHAVSAYAEKLRRFREELGYVLTYDPEVARRNSHFRLNWVLTTVSIATLALSIGGAVWLLRRERKRPPRPPGLPGRLNGLGGWLVLIGFGVVVRPLADAVQLIKTFSPYFDLRRMEPLTLPESESYLAGFETLLVAEAACNLALLAAGVFLAFLFFSKSRLFPTVFIIWMVSATLFGVADVVATQSVMKETDALAYKDAARVALSCAIWIPYMCVSKRVRQTFVK